MKRYDALCLLGLLVFSFPSQAQIVLIPKAGMSSGTYQLKANWLNQTASPGVGLTAGVGVAIPAGRIPWLSFQPELNYVQKSVTFNQTVVIPEIGLVSHSQNARRNHYLEVPLLAKARLGRRAVRGFVQAGPSLGLFLGSKSKLTIDGQPITLTPDMAAPTIGKTSHSFELSLQAGGGVGIAMGPGTFLLEARYGVGLTNFIKKHQMEVTPWAMEEYPDQTFSITVPADQKSRTFLLTCGYAVPLTK